MEIGHEGVKHLKAITGIDKNIGPAGTGAHDTVLPCPGLDGAAGCGTHADHATAAVLGRIDEICRLLGDHTVLTVHLVVGDLILLHRPEGAKTHVQRHITDVHAHFLQPCQEFRGKVQSCRRGRRRSVDLGIYGLVALAVLQFFLDIGRQRHLAQTVEHLQEDTFVAEFHQTVAAGQLLHHFTHQFAVAKGNFGAYAHLLTGAHQTLPDVVPAVDQQQHFAGAATGQAVA